MECKQKCYNSKLASLNESHSLVAGANALTGQTYWVTQLLNEDTPTPVALAENFNSFLAALTSHFTPLDLSLADLDHNLDVPGSFMLKSPADIKPGAKSRTINRLGRQRFLTRSGRNLLLNLLHLLCLVRARIHPLSDQGVSSHTPPQLFTT